MIEWAGSTFMRVTCDNRSNTSSPTCDNRGINYIENRNYRRMYREWLIDLVDKSPRGTKARLAEHLNVNGDVVSKILSGVREITAEELPKISKFFGMMPPGFEDLMVSSGRLQSDDEILSMLKRIDGLDGRGIELAMMTIETAKAAKDRTPSQPDDHDRSEPSNRPRELTPSR